MKSIGKSSPMSLRAMYLAAGNALGDILRRVRFLELVMVTPEMETACAVRQLS